jgi:hypothetical protein
MFSGTKHPDTAFQYQYLGKGNEQEGPGFYFTNSEQDARKYAYPNGAVLVVSIRFRKMVSQKSKPRRLELMEMIHNSTSWKNGQGWMNFDEDPVVAMRNLLRYCMDEPTQHDAFLTVWAECYRYDPEEYCRNMIKLGYDGVLIERGYRNQDLDAPTHIVAFDPRKITIENSIPYTSQRKKVNKPCQNNTSKSKKRRTVLG